MTAEELLLQLRDIQPPRAPPWWLPAPAELVLTATLCALLGAGWWLLRRRRANRLAKLAENDLRRIRAGFAENGDARLLATQLSEWLRRIALLAYPENRPQGVCGDAWLEFLDRGLDDRPFSRGCGRIFAAAVYQPRVAFDAERVFELCERWLHAIRPRLRQRGSAG